ncbi:MAG: YraN family protein [Candidatus Melainabacteria bacterium]|nr:YraN family protein [Candidatus Melainabacteria bacterium]
MDENNKSIGNRGECRATSYLEELGYQILERNWRWSNKGEIDIIAIDPNRFRKKYLIFIEVKYRAWSLDSALRAVGYEKIQQLKTLAKVYLLKNKLDLNKTCFSFDVIAISDEKLRHIKDIV